MDLRSLMKMRYAIYQASNALAPTSSIGVDLHLAAAPIARDGVCREGNERSNIDRKNEFDLEGAKWLRMIVSRNGPACKKMMDLRANVTSKVSASRCTDQGLRDASRRRWRKLAKFHQLNVEKLPDASTILRGFVAILSKRRLSDIARPGNFSQPNTRNTPKNGGGPSDGAICVWKEGRANVEPSTNVLALIKFIQEWESTGDKIICFSQCRIQSSRYDGSMNRGAREAVLARFRQPGGPRVILISMKCGGVGLNLTSANRVVNLDLSWNYASESQAYDRVHRLGQEKEVVVRRLVVNNTLEERMLHLQDTKTGLAEAALGEGTGLKLHKLSVRELKDLFGMSRDREMQNQGRLPYAAVA
ncbi:P-loop containing nucleoside triphosphate hydrolase protein [Irpex lacteus]|nr:P-loop containing nucleoside triphosphate hydrolase protein [Irpex lacteus]